VLTDAIADAAECDAITAYAAAVPVRVIGDMFAVPESDRAALRGWSLAILGALEPRPDAAMMATGNRAVIDFAAYLHALIADRRTRPGDPEEDLLTRLIGGESEDEPLSANELVHNSIFLLNAGHETTSNLIGNALHLLAMRPALLSDLVHDRSILPGFVEEVLRFESPNQLGNRRTAMPVVLEGVELASGTGVTLMIGAANRDSERFGDPDRFDPRRTPNRHLAFGAGGHQCAGLSLARLEAAVAIGAWIDRFPRFALAAPVEWQRRVRFRGLERLNLALRARA
jgi:cytochrome P450